MAKEMQEKGYNQTEIAETLSITQPAVSQYLSSARGKKVQRLEQHEESYERVQNLIQLLLDDASRENIADEFCNICAITQENEILGFESEEEKMMGDCDLHPN